MNPILVIPARLAASRLPGKPLADIAGLPMIVHVWRRAMEAALGPVLVACAEPEIADAIRQAGGMAALTDPALPSGSDRIAAALAAWDPERRHDVVVNVQGDLPTLDPALPREAVATLGSAGDIAIATLAARIVDEAERENPNVVKCVAAFAEGVRGEAGAAPARARALYFSRTSVPSGPGPLYHHIGLYAFRRAALERFVAAPPGLLERRERLEQLRALEMGLRIEAALVDTVPLGVDTPADLARARALLCAKDP